MSAGIKVKAPLSLKNGGLAVDAARSTGGCSHRIVRPLAAVFVYWLAEMHRVCQACCVETARAAAPRCRS